MSAVTMTVEIARPTFERMLSSDGFDAPGSPFVEVTLPGVPRVGEDLWWREWSLEITSVHWVDGCTAPSLRAR